MIIIIMRKICKIKFSKIKLNKNKPVSARNMQKKKKKPNKRKKERKLKMTAMSESSRLTGIRLIPSSRLLSVCYQFTISLLSVYYLT